MIYVLNKNKIVSYIIASFIVIGLFAFSTSIIQNKDIELVKVSSNAINNNMLNNVNNIENNYFKYW